MSEIMERLENMGGAYEQLHAGASTLLEIDRLFWTERLLLRLVRGLYGRRLGQIGGVLSDDKHIGKAGNSKE